MKPRGEKLILENPDDVIGAAQAVFEVGSQNYMKLWDKLRGLQGFDLGVVLPCELSAYDSSLVLQGLKRAAESDSDSGLRSRSLEMLAEWSSHFEKPHSNLDELLTARV